MTINEIQNNISEIFKQPNGIQIYLLLKVENKFVLRLADIENDTAANEIKCSFIEFLNTNIVNNEEIIIRNLSVADESPNAIYQYDYTSYPEELELFKNFNIYSDINENKFNFQNDNLKNLFGYIIYIGSHENGIFLFKKHYPISLIKRGSILIMKKHNTLFEKLPSEDIIRLSSDVQLLRINGDIFVLDLKILERNMGFHKLIQRDAEKAVCEIEKLDILDDIDELRDVINEPTLARKLSKIQKESSVFNAGISKDNIIEFTKTNPGLAGEFKYSNEGTKIKLGTKKSKIAFIKLLNDSFLRSELTKQHYDASAKDKIVKNVSAR